MRHDPILFLDLATKTGWAVGEPGGQISYGSIRFARPSEDQAAAFGRFSVWLDGMIGEHGVSEVVFEQPMDPRHMVDRKTKRNLTSFATIRLLLGLCAITEERGRLAGVRVTETSVHSIRKHILSGQRPPKGQAKTVVAQRLKMLGYNPTDGDASDAIAGWLYASAIRAPGADIATPLPLGRGA